MFLRFSGISYNCKPFSNVFNAHLEPTWSIIGPFARYIWNPQTLAFTCALACVTRWFLYRERAIDRNNAEFTRGSQLADSICAYRQLPMSPSPMVAVGHKCHKVKATATDKTSKLEGLQASGHQST